VRLFSRHVKELKRNVPDFTTIWWRVTKIMIDLDPKVNPNEEITIAVDSTGIRLQTVRMDQGEVAEREERVHQDTRRGDTKSKQILSMKVTQEDTVTRRC